MRRRQLILLFLAAGVLVAAAVALADPPATTTAQPVFVRPGAQIGPAVAVDPGGGTAVSAVAVGTDWSAGPQLPETSAAQGTITTSSGVTSWNDHTPLPPSNVAADISGGSPDVVWGPGSKVYAVELGRDAADPTNPCASGAGLYLSVSTNAGAAGSWTTFQLGQNGQNQAISDPSIAYSAVTGKIYIAYTKLDPCTDGPGSTSVIRVVTATDTGVGNPPVASVSPGAANAQFGQPSIAALPNGNIAVAYYDDAQSPGQVLVTTCSPTADPVHPTVCAPSPVTVDPAAPDPGALGALPVDVRPMIAAGSDGRVVVAWAKETDQNGMDVFSATSRDSGASFGQPVRVPIDAGAADQFDPAIAIASDGRADLAFYDSVPGGYKVYASASNKPTGTFNQETWSQSVPVESTVIAPVPATAGGAPTLGARLGVDEVPRAGGREWTLIAWTDTRNVLANQNEDVFSSVLLHQSTSPVGVAAPAFDVPKNVTSAVPFTATDADADPLTYSIAQQGALGAASIPDPNVPQFLYSAPKVLGTDQVQIRMDDGVHQSTMTVPVQIVNTPPTITCSSLSTNENTPVSITAAGCASDLNGDPVTLTATSPADGTLQPSGNGVNFVPTTGFTGTGQVTLTASDGSATVAATIPVHVLAPDAIPVTIMGTLSRSARTDRPILLHAVAASNTDEPITWTFGDKTTDEGQYVSHLFQSAHTYDVSAQIGNGPASHITVIVQKPPLDLQQTKVATDGSIELRVQLADAGRLTVGMVGVPGARAVKGKMKRGTHTVQMTLPDAVRSRGSIVVNLALNLPNGGIERVRRAVLLPRN
jgi:Bacterial Ig domain